MGKRELQKQRTTTVGVFRSRRLLEAAERERTPKYVQELLGRASIALTLDTYSHVLPGMGGGVADAMEDALS